MFGLRVFYSHAFRYKIIANVDKAHELRSQGFYVQIKELTGQNQGSGPA
ncbi:MAG: hypothetical protein OEV35_01985 [Gallionellaceae bacterium]|nr:hypothetical protein [Gallionellaceae bacterium]